MNIKDRALIILERRSKKESLCCIAISAGMILMIVGYITFSKPEVIPVDPLTKTSVQNCFAEKTKKYIELNTVTDFKAAGVLDRSNTKFELNGKYYNLYLNDYYYCLNK